MQFLVVPINCLLFKHCYSCWTSVCVLKLKENSILFLTVIKKIILFLVLTLEIQKPPETEMIIIVLHLPLVCHSYLFWRCNSTWEQHSCVVYWVNRGTGLLSSPLGGDYIESSLWMLSRERQRAATHQLLRHWPSGSYFEYKCWSQWSNPCKFLKYFNVLRMGKSLKAMCSI